METAMDQVSYLSQFPPGAQDWVNDILVWIGFGTLVGLLAKALMPGRDPGGAIATLLMGIGGVIIGCGAWSLFSRGPRITPVSPVGMMVAVAGALSLLFFYRLLGGYWFLEGEVDSRRTSRRPTRRRRAPVAATNPPTTTSDVAGIRRARLRGASRDHGRAPPSHRSHGSGVGVLLVAATHRGFFTLSCRESGPSALRFRTHLAARPLRPMSNVIEVSHPLITHHMVRLRDKETPPSEFRLLIGRLAVLLAYEATKDLQVREQSLETPLCATVGQVLDQRIGIVPILRAGLGMVDPILNLIPDAEVWHLGLYRDEETACPVEYYSKIPPKFPLDVALIVDPMLATGGSARAALAALQKRKVPRLKLLSVIASQEGIAAVEHEFPGTQIYVCAIDPELNNEKFIVPGLGDAGDRIFNTR